MNILKHKDVFTEAYKPYKPKESEVNLFKQALEVFIERTDGIKDEEHNKNFITSFLQTFAYQNQSKYEINTVGKIDLAISKLGYVEVLIEVKRPYSKGKTVPEMVRPNDMNRKAFHEALLYYMRQINPTKNIKSNPYIKHIIITNNIEWYIIEANQFNILSKNTEIKKAYKEIDKDGTASDTSTKAFYTKAEEIIRNENLLNDLEFVYIDFSKKLSLTQIRDIYKILSPRHLLSERGENDSNTLNKKFYNELLHILGLAETGKGVKLIQRKEKDEREYGSLLENTIGKLESKFGFTDENKLFEIALELNITWLNRILFLKLLEARLLAIHNGKFDKFLTIELISNFDNLYVLFFDVLAKKLDNRENLSVEEFRNIPYLNSSLFEPTQLEKEYLVISGLNTNLTMTVPTSSKTNMKGKEHNTLAYFLTFLNSYDFGGDITAVIKKDNESLINASVLGLIFEKINGYKDGSFYTPSFITMYMTRESIRQAIIDKFNDEFGWNCKTINNIYDKEPNTETANKIINSITICDPAVGSGHYLVSALNEILVVKSELKVLQNRTNTRRIRTEISIINDELCVKNTNDDSGNFFQYHQNENGSFFAETQEIQEAIFHEKQSIIENQLFGVDINPNSVNITRLRLWIELLKHSYYRNGELVTLPNIDINIKCGNSLVSRFPLQDSKKSSQLLKEKVADYKQYVKRYKDTNDKDVKNEAIVKIEDIKKTFTKRLRDGSPEILSFKKLLNGEMTSKKITKGYIDLYGFKGLKEELIFSYGTPTNKIRYSNPEINASLFGDAIKLSAIEEKNHKVAQVKELKKVLSKYKQLKTLEDNKIYENSFEWRFEFPEVLNEDGDFIGFDIIIGNPPYFNVQTFGAKALMVDYLKSNYSDVWQDKSDILFYFIAKSIDLTKDRVHFIISNAFLYSDKAQKLRNYILKNAPISKIINFEKFMVFDDASITTSIIELSKKTKVRETLSNSFVEKNYEIGELVNSLYNKEDYHLVKFKQNHVYSLADKEISSLNEKIDGKYPNLNTIIKIGKGMETAGNKQYSFKEYPSQFPQEFIKKRMSGEIISKYGIAKEKEYLLYFEDVETFDELPQSIQTHLTDNRDFLEKRADKKRRKTSKWWTYTFPMHKDYYHLDKIWCSYRGKENTFCFDDTQEYIGLTNTTVIFNTNKDLDLKYVLALLNSKALTFRYKTLGKQTGSGIYEFFENGVGKLPIPIISKEEQLSYIDIVNNIIRLKKEENDTQALEDRLDKIVYKLYGLSEEEINIIEESILVNTKV